MPADCLFDFINSYFLHLIAVKKSTFTPKSTNLKGNYRGFVDICVPQMSRDYDCLSVSEVCLSRTTDYLSHGKNILMTACQYLRHNCPNHQKLTMLQEDSKVGSFLSCQLWNFFVMRWVTNKQTTMSLEKLWNEENPRLQPANSASLLPS